MPFFTNFSSGLDHSRKELARPLSTPTMLPELTLAVVLFDVGAVVLALLHAVSQGYLWHPRRMKSINPVASPEPCAQTAEQAGGVPAAAATTALEPAQSPVQALYETVQPTTAPVPFAAPSTMSFGAPSASKPSRTCRRRSAPIRSTVVSRGSLRSRRKSTRRE